VLEAVPGSAPSSLIILSPLPAPPPVATASLVGSGENVELKSVSPDGFYSPVPGPSRFDGDAEEAAVAAAAAADVVTPLARPSHTMTLVSVPSTSAMPSTVESTHAATVSYHRSQSTGAVGACRCSGR
jgi:hypothetical protein